MKRSSDRILTTHPGRLPNPDNQDALVRARLRGDQATFDQLVAPNIAEIVRRQKALGLDIICDGEFWKARDALFYNSRATGIEARPIRPGEYVSTTAMLLEKRTPEFRAFWEIYDILGNTPRPGAVNVPASERYVMGGPVKGKGPAAINHEIDVVKAGIAAAGERVENCFFPVLGPGWLDHFVWNEYYRTEEEYCFALAEIIKADFKSVVDAGFILQIDDPGLLDRWGTVDPPVSIDEYRRQESIRIEATNWALEGIPENRVRFHTCWGSWHTPHTADIPLEHMVDIMLRVNCQAYSVEAADVRHELDYRVWERVKLPEGKIYIPGVIAHKTNTIEPAEVVAHRIVRYARIMGRENVVAGVDCGVGNRNYPDIGWAKLKALTDGAALASQELWN